ncbi:hypothetical protein ACFU76_17510 [Streptomyces sp. NPDC057539]
MGGKASSLDALLPGASRPRRRPARVESDLGAFTGHDGTAEVTIDRAD